jgi:hypothetical protein
MARARSKQNIKYVNIDSDVFHYTKNSISKYYIEIICRNIQSLDKNTAVLTFSISISINLCQEIATIASRNLCRS